jgi:PKHD-type hydroxylase
MINDFTTFVPKKRFIDEDHCKHIIQTGIAGGKYEGFSKVGLDAPLENHKVRKSEVYFFRNLELERHILGKVLEINQSLWKFDVTEIETLQLSIYQDGGHYMWHADNDTTSKSEVTRKLSFSLLLNSGKDFNGGELELETWLMGNNGFDDVPFTSYKIKAPAVPGTLIVFPSYVRHRVLPVTKGVRYSLVGWITGKPWI